jgi:hypothetical protein
MATFVPALCLIATLMAMIYTDWRIDTLKKASCGGFAWHLFLGSLGAFVGYFGYTAFRAWLDWRESKIPYPIGSNTSRVHTTYSNLSLKRGRGALVGSYSAGS